MRGGDPWPRPYDRIAANGGTVGGRSRIPRLSPHPGDFAAIVDLCDRELHGLISGSETMARLRELMQ